MLAYHRLLITIRSSLRTLTFSLCDRTEIRILMLLDTELLLLPTPSWNLLYRWVNRIEKATAATAITLQHIQNSIVYQFRVDCPMNVGIQSEFRILMDVVIIVSVSIMPLINISTIAHFINDVETEELRCPNDSIMSQLIIFELSWYLSSWHLPVDGCFSFARN